MTVTIDRMRRAVRDYLAALEASDLEALAALFTPDGTVHSPLLGPVPARAFFAKVAAASSDARLEIHDVLASTEGNPRAAAYFRYDWRLKDGTEVSFECADVFEFDVASGRVRTLTILYDTHPLRDRVAGQYS